MAPSVAVGGGDDDDDVRQRILAGLSISATSAAAKHIPFSLLYNSTGSSLYEQILSNAPSYYLYSAELRLLRRHSSSIASSLPANCLLLELGCGSASKSLLLIDAFLSLHGRCHYVGIDVSPASIQEAERNILQHVGRKSVSLSFIEGDYLPSVKRAKAMFPDKLICVLWLGSSIGNLGDDEAVEFMKQIVDVVGPTAMFFLCTDLWKEDAEMLYRAYCDDGGYTERFIKNGMIHALSLLGYTATETETESWEYKVTVNSERRRVEMWVIFPAGLEVKSHNVRISAGEGVLVEFSRKFTISDIEALAASAGLSIHAAWRNRTYSCQMLCSVREALLRCWHDTDAIFDGIDDWTQKPIDLRQPFLFYYGHVAAFAIGKLLNGGGGDRRQLDLIFSRGIDPYVLDASRCHEHPETPSQWPKRECVVDYVKSVRSLLTEAVDGGTVSHRLILLALEHERMHQETLEYMLAQRTKAEFEKRTPKAWKLGGGGGGGEGDGDGDGGGGGNCDIVIPPGSVRMGVNASESLFTWDNESPSTERTVSEAFAVSRKAVSVRQFMAFVTAGGYETAENWRFAEDFAYFKRNGFRWPSTWSEVGGDFYVHSTKESKHWAEVGGDPVYVSLAEAEAYCKWAADGLRIMTEEEYERAIDVDMNGEMKIEDLTEGGWEWTSSTFAGFPGFQAMEEYPEYSVDFFDGKHYVLKGSSPATHPSLVRASFRNFYQRQYRFVFAKFRCCRTVGGVAAGGDQ